MKDLFSTILFIIILCAIALYCSSETYDSRIDEIKTEYSIFESQVYDILEENKEAMKQSKCFEAFQVPENIAEFDVNQKQYLFNDYLSDSNYYDNIEELKHLMNDFSDFLSNY